MSQSQTLLTRFPVLNKISNLPKPVLLALGPALLAIITVLMLWGRGPAYGVLFSNINDRDGAAIVAALAQMNVPYRFSPNGTALLIPENHVYETRMQLAGQGLPRTGNAGFELLDNTRFGASQFTEQLTYQRALEGELANSIRVIQSVEQARVHLAIPRDSLFVRERQAPTASVLLNLYPGRSLSPAQVSAITWLISSSVPNLEADKVSIVDQYGKLLTSSETAEGGESSQRNFINEVELRTSQRITNLLTPLLGVGNVRAQATADVDFSHREETSEIYRPNQQVGQEAVRSKQISEAGHSTDLSASGIPGALSNQPPAPVTAPIEANHSGAADESAPPATQTAGPPAQADQTARAITAAANRPDNSRYDATINYEVDRTIQHIKEPRARLRRLSVAVVLNYQQNTNGEMVSLSQDELLKIERLVKEAMGFSRERGDTLSVVNSQFSSTSEPEIAIWKNPEYQGLAWQGLKYLVGLLALLFVWFKILTPLSSHITSVGTSNPRQTDQQTETGMASDEDLQRNSEMTRYEENLRVARQLATKDPRAVAMVLRSWMEKNAKS